MTITGPLGEYPNSVEETPLWFRSTAMQGLGLSAGDVMEASKQQPSLLTQALTTATSTIQNILTPNQNAPITAPSVAPAPKNNTLLYIGLGLAGLAGLMFLRGGKGKKSSYRSRARRNPRRAGAWRTSSAAGRKLAALCDTRTRDPRHLANARRIIRAAKAAGHVF